MLSVACILVGCDQVEKLKLTSQVAAKRPGFFILNRK